MTFPMAPAAIIWDGARQVAAIWHAPAHARFLAAEEAGGRISLMAAGNAEDAPLIGTLPPGSRVVHLVTISAEGALSSLPVQLDERLTPGEAAVDAPGLALLRITRTGPDGASLAAQRQSAEGSEPPAGSEVVASGLNQIGEDGVRLLAGPFLHPEDARAGLTRVCAEVGTEGAGLSLRFAGDEAATGVLVAHVPAAMRQARRSLAPLDDDLRLAIETELDGIAAAPANESDLDASGLGQVAAMRRGFQLLYPKPDGRGGCRLDLPGWVHEDEVLLFAEPRRTLLWTGTGEPASGAPMTISWRDGALGAIAHREDYAASLGTGLTLSGRTGSALVLSTPGSAPALNDDLALAAGRLADRLWREAGAERPARLSDVLTQMAATRAAEAGGDGILSLDARSRAADGPGHLLGALAELAGIEPSRADELGERSLSEQVAMVLWGLDKPRIAARACAARLLLPLPARAAPTLEALLGWYEDPNLPHLLNREATALAGQDRRAMRLLQDIAACAHQSWLDDGAAAEVEKVVTDARAMRGQRPLGSLDSLIAELRSQPQRQPAETPVLETVARMRAELGSSAAESGQRPAIIEDLAKRLPELTPAEIVLLHGYFSGLQRDAAQSRAASALIEAWEGRVGHDGLAARAHRGGDVLLGAARLAGKTGGFAPMLERIESLGPALAALRDAIAAVLGPEAGQELHAKALRRTLDGYGRLLLLQAVLREADAALAGIPFAANALREPENAGLGAAYRRLRHQAGDAPGRYLAAAAAATGLDHEWGVAFILGTTQDTRQIG